MYVIAMKTSKDGEYLVRSFARNPEHEQFHYTGVISNVEALLGDCRFEHKNDGLHIYSEITSDYPIVFRISFS
jgi:alpha-L-fucosidase